ncbi:hypothetical protein [Nocardioides sp. GCM10030258]|uniref:hypothetical protein n=1 Tax=unclassified Nocardioides TaxID=2615069 RepID=UPI0036231F3F
MSFAVTATVIVSAAPAALDPDRSPPTTVFPISYLPDASATNQPAGDTSICPGIGVGEVVCRGELAVQAREELRAGQQIVVTGELTPRPSLSHTTEEAAVILIIEAKDIGINVPCSDME